MAALEAARGAAEAAGAGRAATRGCGRERRSDGLDAGEHGGEADGLEGEANGRTARLEAEPDGRTARLGAEPDGRTARLGAGPDGQTARLGAMASGQTARLGAMASGRTARLGAMASGLSARHGGQNGARGGSAKVEPSSRGPKAEFSLEKLVCGENGKLQLVSVDARSWAELPKPSGQTAMLHINKIEEEEEYMNMMGVATREIPGAVARVVRFSQGWPLPQSVPRPSGLFR